MKHKLIEKLPCKRPAGMEKKDPGKYVAAQLFDRYLILDLWSGGEWRCRHVTDTESGEYATCDADGGWTRENVCSSDLGKMWRTPSATTGTCRTKTCSG